jgi:hypothetical protein
MKIRGALLGLVLLAGCGDSEETWEERAEHLAGSLCRYQSTCLNQGDFDGCYNDVVNDMRSAKEQLSDEAEVGCMNCMEAKILELSAANDSACRTEPDAQRVRTACGSGDEACAGYP